MSVPPASDSPQSGDNGSNPWDEVGALRRAKDGDESAFGELFQRSYPAVHAFVARQLGDRAVADRLTEEVFSYVAKHIQSCRGASFRLWTFRVAAQLARAEYGNRTVARAGGDGAEAVEGMDALKLLTFEMRRVVSLAWGEKLNIRQVANVLNCRKMNVSWLLFLARRRLKESTSAPRPFRLVEVAPPSESVRQEAWAEAVFAFRNPAPPLPDHDASTERRKLLFTVLAAGLTLAIVLSMAVGIIHRALPPPKTSYAQVLYERRKTVGPDLDAILLRKRGEKVLTSPHSAGLRSDQPVVVDVRGQNDRVRVLTFSGRVLDIEVEGRTVRIQPLITGSDTIIVRGDDFVATQSEPFGNGFAFAMKIPPAF